MVVPFSKTYGKIWVGFCFNTGGKRFFLEVSDFLNSSPFQRSACFYVIIIGNFERFQKFKFETDFLENKPFPKKLEYSFLIESTKTKNASCQKPMLKQIEWWLQNGPITKNRSFASNYFVFIGNFISV